MSGPVPVIDVTGLRLDPSVRTTAGTVAAIDAACTGTGFFAITGHGVDGAAAAVFAAARAFFALPLEIKDRSAMVDVDDGRPGLEVRPLGGDWTPVEAPSGSLVVNLGDMLARWTNLRYASTPHRVVPVADAPRFSVPFFVNPDAATQVSCLPSCVDDAHPCRFEPITAGEFLRGRIDGTIPTGDGTHR